MSRPAAGPRQLSRGRRQGVILSTTELVRMEPLVAGQSLPLLIQPVQPGVDLSAWARENNELILAHLREHGAILFRSFGLSSAGEFEEVVRAASGELLEYRERSSPRSEVSGRVYTSTDYPPSQPIFLHNENSYQHTWPSQIFFFCHTAPAQQGETPLADTRRIWKKISPQVRDRFLEKGWMYQRNFGAGFGLPWQTVFQTEDKEKVEAYCQANGIEYDWRSGDQLQTRAIRRPAFAHPETGEMVWFNHATFFHVTTLPEAVREVLLEEFDESDLPSNSYYGDGTSIEPKVLEHLRAVYKEETVVFPWQRGDLLMLDNMMVAHGRSPFEGERKILVGMARPLSWQELDARNAAKKNPPRS